MKLLKRNKKGFTIVELVIVIAVIAVLAAVLIPTFMNLTAKANKAADDSLVTSLNKALAIEEVDHDIDNMHDAMKALEREGYNADVLITKSNQKLLYHLDSNRFLLEEGKDGNVEDYKYWTLSDSYDSENQKYSIYASGDFSEEEIDNLEVGFDAGDVFGINSVSYVGTGSEQNVVVRTNSSNTTVTVNAPTDVVNHYGKANSVNIIAVKSSSYHEYGEILGNISLTQGHLSFEKGSSAGAVIIDLSTVASDSTKSLSLNTNGINVPVVVDKTSAEVLSNVDLEIGTNTCIDLGVEGVAVIKDTGYATLQEAIEAAGEHDTILLIDDIQLAKNVAILINKTVTLNLNGKTIEGNSDPLFVLGSTAASYQADSSTFTHTGHLTIKGNGSIINNNWDAIIVYPDAVLDIYGGHYNSYAQTLYAKGGIVNTYGGTFTSYAIKANNLISCTSGSTCNLFAGNFVTQQNGCYGIYVSTAAEVNLGVRGEEGPTVNTWRAAISTNGSLSNSGNFNIYSGTYKANRNDNTTDDSGVIQLANATNATQTLNIYGGSFEQTNGLQTSCVFNFRYAGSINVNITGGTFKCSNSSTMFSAFGNNDSGWPSESNVRVNVQNNVIPRGVTVEMYNSSGRLPDKDFIINN